MKYNITLIIILLHFVSAIKAQRKPVSNHPAIIEYNLKGSLKENLYFLKKYTINGDENIIRTVSQANIGFGTNEVRVNTKTPTIVYVKYLEQEFPIYIDNENKTFVDIDLSDSILELNFSGLNKSINNYLQAKERILKDEYLGLEQLYSMSLDSFLSINSRIEGRISKLRGEYFSKIDNENFKQFDIADIEAFVSIKKVLFSDYHNYFTKEKLPPLLQIRDVDVNRFGANDLNLLSLNCVDLLGMYLDNHIRRAKKCEKEDYSKQVVCFFNEKINLAQSIFKAKNVRDFFSVQVLLQALEIGMDSFFNANLANIKSNAKDSEFLSVAVEKEKTMKIIGKGQKAPDITFVKTDGTVFNLKDLMGKKVYINVWSFGCSSSVRELNNINKLIDDFKDKDDCHFINICMDDSSEKLREYSETVTIKGANVTVQNFLDFKKQYFVVSLPRYILIDKGGKIDTPFAARPSSTEVKRQLNACN